jgi:hypothetical protein
MKYVSELSFQASASHPVEPLDPASMETKPLRRR